MGGDDIRRSKEQIRVFRMALRHEHTAAHVQTLPGDVTRCGQAQVGDHPRYIDALCLKWLSACSLDILLHRLGLFAG